MSGSGLNYIFHWYAQLLTFSKSQLNSFADLFISCTFEKRDVSSAKNLHIEVIQSGRSFTHLFYKQRFFSTQPQCCLTFWWIEPPMLLRYYLVHKSIIILRHLVYLLYLCSCLDLSLFMSYLCDLFFIFIFIFIMINRIISWIHVLLFII